MEWKLPFYTLSRINYHISSSLSTVFTVDCAIKKAYNNAKAIAEQYGTTYNRNLEDRMYEINDGTDFFITNDGNVYIVYPYGNIEYTNEIDIVIF